MWLLTGHRSWHGRDSFLAPRRDSFLAPREVTGLALIRTPGGKAVLVANHGDSLQAFTITRR